MSSRGTRLARRAFLVGAGVVGGGLLVGAGALALRLKAIEGYTLPHRDDAAGFGAWLSIDRAGAVEVMVPHQEMGQGIYALAALLAAEGLRLPGDRVRPVPAPIAAKYANPVMMLDGLPFDPQDDGPVKGVTLWTFDKILRALGAQATGGSTSTRNIADPIRLCAAATLDLLTRAAAARWGVPPQTLTATDGVIAAPDGRHASYGELAEAAAKLAPRDIAPPNLAPGRYVGRGMARADVPAKTRGAARYGIDAREPGQLFAAIRHAPRIAGRLAQARLPPGLRNVRDLVEGRDYVAVVATDFASALAALDEADVQWDEAAGLTLSSADVFAAYRAALDKGARHAPRWTLDAAGTMASPAPAPPAGTTILRATYQAPFLAHAAMEPINATALVTPTRCVVWCGHQSPTLVQMMAGRAANLSADAVEVHTPFLGGGFGRRADLGYVAKAVEIAKRFPGVPVQTIWTREEDFRDDVFRPAAMADIVAAVDPGGLPATFEYRIAVPSITDQFVARIFPASKPGLVGDRTTVDGAVFPLYALPNRRIETVGVDLGVPVGFWRSVGYSLNCFFFESFIDELSVAAGLQPLDYRARLLGLATSENAKRAGRLVQRLARYDAQTPLPQTAGKTGRGFAVTEAFHSLLGHAADVVIEGADIRVRKVHVVVDCGFAIDPPNVIAQVRGAVNFGLSAALYGSVEIDQGRIVPANFDSYRVLTLADAPDITVEIVNSSAAIGGVGEIGTPGIAPAVANAIFAATGQRLRSLPLTLASA